MRIQIVTANLVVIEAKNEEMTDDKVAQVIVRSALEEKGLAQWSSIEIEDYTYNNSRLVFAKPIKIYIPSFMARLTN